MCAERRIGIFGGTFDPVHLGHLASAREIAGAFSLDTILLVLAARPPHKPDRDAAPDAMRWEMLNLAAREDRDAHPGSGVSLEPCDIELRRSGPSYTVDTLTEITALHPGAELFLILGIDAWAEIDTWSRPAEIPRLANVIVTSRPGCDFPQGAVIPPVAARPEARYDSSIGVHIHTSGHTIVGHNIGGIEVSATDIRRRVREGLPIAHLTGDRVARFIQDNGLYGSDRGSPAPVAPRATVTKPAKQ